MSTPDRSADSPDAPSRGRRLESWKAIAAYLKRTVRTVHRWEKEQGLPVHRHLHLRQGTVYAYTGELDAWWAQRSMQPPAVRQPWLTPRRAVLALLVAAAVAVAALVTLNQPASDRPGVTQVPDSIAVLPFRTLGGDDDDALLGYGIAEEVLDRLARTGSLNVIARTSAFAFGEAPLDPVAVAGQLGVEYLLTGVVQRDGEQLRVRARLLDEHGRQRWSRSFDFPPQGLFELQDRIADAVAASLAPQLEGLQETGHRPHPEAYRDYLLGRELLRLRDRSAAIAAFERAIERDPQFARPYGGLAMVHAIQSGQVMGRLDYARATESAQRALALDPQLAEAHAALGLLAIEQGRLEDADASLRRALELDPNLVDARYWLTTYLQEAGRHEEAERELQTALQIDPLHPLLNTSLGLRYWGRGDYAGARERFLRVLELPRPTIEPYVRLVALNRDFGRLGEALRWAKEAVLRHPGFATLSRLVHTFSQLELDEDVARWMERVRTLEGDGPPRLGLHSEVLFYRGDFEAIYRMKMEYLQRAGRPLSELPFVIRETLGGMMVMTGRYEDGIRVLEPLFGENFRIPQHLGGLDFALTFAQLLAHAYQQVGRHEDATALLHRIQAHIAMLRAAGSGHRPRLYMVEARNFALLGETRKALQTLRLAVNSGWRDPAFERHIPAWDALRDDAEYQALMALVEADVAAQRSLVEAQGRDVAFETAALAALGLPGDP
ncbi:MAG TPA: tetratricopeptide repeat protein [Gammaproteobacteria bacterium]|nr:tetratricopeptide repeat protein [Gammaproteobacteria bacterium]